MESLLPTPGDGTPTESPPTLRPLCAADLTYSYTTAPRPVPSEEELKSCPESICTDHMIVATWNHASGWSTPELKPYGDLTLKPLASCLHYASECFEGLKAYRGYDGQLRVFRIDRNMVRLQASARRVCLPGFDADEMKKLTLALLAVDGARWLPETRPGETLYIRPTLVGTAAQIIPGPPSEVMLFIVLAYSPLPNMAQGLRLQTSPKDMVRAWPGGHGYAKIGANYGTSFLAHGVAVAAGYHQILWLYGDDGQCTEVGAANFFVVWTRKDGAKELITSPLDDKTILDGVTRRSCLDLARERLSNEIIVTERKFTITEVTEAFEEGRLLECFGAGTGYFILPISRIHHGGQDIDIPVDRNKQSGNVTNSIKGWLSDIMYGKEDHEWTTLVPTKW